MYSEKVFINHVFKRELRNGECVKREWLLYSPSQGRLYRSVCRLLSKSESPFATSWFNDWKHSNIMVEHENWEEHHKIANTCDPALKLLNKEKTSDIHKHKQT